MAMHLDTGERLFCSAPPQEHSADVGDSISEVVRRLEVTKAQKSEGEAYRGALSPLC